jgi:hypothetical protein
MAGAVAEHIDAEENKYRPFRASISYPREMVQFIDKMKLKITLVVTNNSW